MTPSGPATAPTCRHCGTRFQPTRELPEFCCHGCAYVHRLIHERGLHRFYELKNGLILPVRSRAFQIRDYAWLKTLVDQAEAGDANPASISLDLQGISCIGCVWLIERVFRRQGGAVRIETNAPLGQIRLHWMPGLFDSIAFAKEIQAFGYLVGPADGANRTESRSLAARTALCGAMALNAMLFTLPRYLGMGAEFQWGGLFELLALLFASVSMAVGGSLFIGRAWAGATRGILSLDLPIALGLIAAYLGSIVGWIAGVENLLYFDFVSVFTFLMLAGRWVQQMAIERNRSHLLKTQAIPQTVSLYAEPEDRREVAIEQLAAGSLYRVSSGQVVPVESTLHQGSASLSLEWINGEGDPKQRKIGQCVPSGAINIGISDLILRANERWVESLVFQLSSVKPETADSTATPNWVLTIYTGSVIAVAIAGGLSWALATGSIIDALQVVISVLVVSCPCALGVALPLADERAIGMLRRFGVFIRIRDIWSRLPVIRHIVFDKTGTLTLENPILRDSSPLERLSGLQQSVLLRIASANRHPFSRSLYETLMRHGTALSTAMAGETRVQEVPGYGLILRDAEGTWTLGRPGWRGSTAALEPGNRSEGDCEFSLNQQPLARFSFADGVRPDAEVEVRKLSALGFDIHIFSGDRSDKVAAMADRLGVPAENAHGKLTPFEKAERLAPFGARQALMIGDGANDSLAFDAAGCRGTPVINRGFLEHRSDFYFLGSGIQGIRVLFAVARSRHRIVRRIFAFALAYNLAAVALCLAGQMNPLVAAVLMPISSLISLAIAGSGLNEASHPARRSISKWGFPGIPAHRFQLADRELMC